MLENISLAIQGVWSHKLRSFLTMLGIIIGIAAIITIVSTIKGTNDQIKQNLIGSGNNVVTVTLNEDGHEAGLEYGTLPEGVKQATEDIVAELSTLDGVKSASAYHYRSWADGVFYKNSVFSGCIYGVDSHYLSVAGYTVSRGRGFAPSDFASCRKVALIDDRTAQSLFDGEDPVGKTLEMQSEPFTVVGVISQSTGSGPVINSLDDYYMYADMSSGTVLIPDCCWSVIYRYDEPHTFAVRAKSTDDMTKAGRAAADSLNAALVSNTKYEYKANDLLEQAENIQSLSETTNRQLIWIAGISLLVGGIGVMNIMLVSVTERTREIGLKFAIGARQRRILRQFLTEAAVLTSCGGLLGILAGIVMARLISSVMGTPTAISVPAILIAVVFSMVIGILFGLLPAIKASNLNPIQALRRE